MCILSVFLVSVSIFVSSLGLLFSVQFSIKFYFVVYVNQSLSCIRRCRTDLVSIVFPVSFARFLTHFLYFKLSFLEGFRSAFINSVFSFFTVIVLVSREEKVEFKLYESVFYNLQLRFLAEHRVAMLEQCCSNSKQYCSNVATLCCAKNRR